MYICFPNYKSIHLQKCNYPRYSLGSEELNEVQMHLSSFAELYKKNCALLYVMITNHNSARQNHHFEKQHLYML
jgi:hypothetical protein